TQLPTPNCCAAPWKRDLRRSWPALGPGSPQKPRGQRPASRGPPPPGQRPPPPGPEPGPQPQANPQPPKRCAKPPLRTMHEPGRNAPARVPCGDQGQPQGPQDRRLFRSRRHHHLRLIRQPPVPRPDEEQGGEPG